MKREADASLFLTQTAKTASLLAWLSVSPGPEFGTYLVFALCIAQLISVLKRDPLGDTRLLYNLL